MSPMEWQVRASAFASTDMSEMPPQAAAGTQPTSLLQKVNRWPALSSLFRALLNGLGVAHQRPGILLIFDMRWIEVMGMPKRVPLVRDDVQSSKEPSGGDQRQTFLMGLVRSLGITAAGPSHAAGQQHRQAKER
ncbi:MAG: hypothetical protein NXH91_03750 [Phyllobacteriaceae bacterium]|jgi:hypothetical protein|nr:hypothetical protein [Phyllobacteriaceae bacterium]